jgi:hypothetical protein
MINFEKRLNFDRLGCSIEKNPNYLKINYLDPFLNTQETSKKNSNDYNNLLLLSLINQVKEGFNKSDSDHENLREKVKKIEDQNKEIIKLQHENIELNAHIQSLLEARLNIKIIMGAGIISSFFGIIYSLISANYPSCVISGCIFTTAITGMWEAKKNGW